jgi:hypothetical protein
VTSVITQITLIQRRLSQRDPFGTDFLIAQITQIQRRLSQRDPFGTDYADYSLRGME